MQRLTGIGVSPGVVCGRAVVLMQRAQVLRYRVSPERVAEELARLNQARLHSREQLQEIRTRVASKRGPELASMFDAQLLMLDDPMLVPRAETLVRDEFVNADWAVQQAFDEVSAVFDEIADPYLRERKGDVADLAGRLRMNLRQDVASPRDLLRALEESSVLIADELTPSLAAQVDWTKVRGFATDAGSRTYHTAILARSLDVPAVVGLHDAVASIQPGQLVVIDGTDNEIIISPDDATLARVERANRDRVPAESHVRDRQRGAETADGVRIRLDANIEFVDDLLAARYAGAEGVGLYRSEFLLTESQTAPGEEEQYEVYRQLLEGMSPGPVTVRTFDVDEDQLALRSGDPTLAGSWVSETERGSRQGLRVASQASRVQSCCVPVAGVVAPASHGPLRIMFPFVSGVEQLRAAKQVALEAATDLRARGITVPSVPIGVMIEIPAAAYTADLLAREVDFFTIGTNDLIQYCLAVDRADERVSRLYEPLHPAILRVIVMVRRAASRAKIPVSLCGEMAADPALLTMLVGLGLTQFSMTPGAMGVARQVLSELRSDELRAMARRVLRLPTVDEIEDVLLSALGRYSIK
ncbi:MAG: phosphoenolpyruvate--protein phosphotransferase [Vicinamibacterales bacterium]